jgi:hypothetical protein
MYICRIFSVLDYFAAMFSGKNPKLGFIEFVLMTVILTIEK